MFVSVHPNVFVSMHLDASVSVPVSVLVLLFSSTYTNTFPLSLRVGFVDTCVLFVVCAVTYKLYAFV